MAAREAMSVRTFTRRFREETGVSPGQWLTRQRVERARQLLESTDLSVDQVARDAGFGTAQSMRQHLQAALGVTPTAYRRTFRAAGGRQDGPMGRPSRDERRTVHTPITVHTLWATGAALRRCGAVRPEHGSAAPLFGSGTPARAPPGPGGSRRRITTHTRRGLPSSGPRRPLAANR